MSSDAGLLSSSFRQLAYVTNDVDRAMAVFGERHDVARFWVMRDLLASLDGGKQARMHLALAKAGGMEFELIHPLGGDDEVWREILHGCGGFEMHFHHHAQTVSSREELARLRARGIAQGFAVSVSGGTDVGSAFFYIDCRETLGHHVEYLYLPPDIAAEWAASTPVN